MAQTDIWKLPTLPDVRRPPLGGDARPDTASTLPDQPAAPSRPRKRYWIGIAAAAVIAIIFTAIVVGLNHHPPSGNRPTGNHTAALTGPDGVVMGFFNAINTKHWRRAWKLEGYNISKSTGKTYKGWLRGYRTTTHNDNVTITSTRGNTVSVLLVAIQISGQAQMWHNDYTVQDGTIIIPHTVQKYLNPYLTWNVSLSRLSGNWKGRDGSSVRVYEDGIAVSHFRVSQNCRTHPSPPCNSGPGGQIPGGAIVYRLYSEGSNKAYATVVDNSTTHSSGSVTIKFHRSTDTIAMTTGQGGRTTYCGPHASTGPCKLVLSEAS